AKKIELLGKEEIKNSRNESRIFKASRIPWFSIFVNFSHIRKWAWRKQFILNLGLKTQAEQNLGKLYICSFISKRNHDFIWKVILISCSTLSELELFTCFVNFLNDQTFQQPLYLCVSLCGKSPFWEVARGIFPSFP